MPLEGVSKNTLFASVKQQRNKQFQERKMKDCFFYVYINLKFIGQANTITNQTLFSGTQQIFQGI